MSVFSHRMGLLFPLDVGGLISSRRHDSGKTDSVTILPVVNGNVPPLHNHGSPLIHPARFYLPNRCG